MFYLEKLGLGSSRIQQHEGVLVQLKVEAAVAADR